MTRMLGRRTWRGTRMAVCLAAGAQLLLGVHAAEAQGTRGVITGRVTDARSALGIAGATVEVEGTRLGTQTSDDGNYRIANVPAGTHTVIVRRIGYASARQTVTAADNGQATANFAMQQAAVSLDQVVVTGTAGGELRRAIGNTVATIDASVELQKSAAPNLAGLLAARAPGVIISPNTSRLGAGPTVQIRGRTSLSLDNSPLVYIDGVRVNNATQQGAVAVSGGGSSFGGQASNVGGRLNDINPEDIESIEVIKGPAAATIYGTEAANGVIQIITKKGASNNRPELSLQVQTGSIYFRDAEGRVPTNYMKNAQGQIVTWNGVEQEKDRGTPLFKTGQSRSYSGSLSGGRDLLRYYLSASYDNDLGVEPNNSIRNFSAHSNLNIVANDKFDLGTSLNFVDLSAHLGADVGVSAMLGATAGHALLFPAARGFYPNFLPGVPQQLYDNAQDVNRFTGSTTMNHRPTTWFSQRLIVGLDYTGDDSRALERYATPELATLLPPALATGRIGQTIRRNTVITGDYSGTAKFNLTPALTSSSSIGGQFYRTDFNRSSLGGFNFAGAGLTTVSGATTKTEPQQEKTLNTTIGAYGQEQFGWRDRLFLTAALRVDNNSAFGEEFKWVTYPKVSVAWVVNEEPFWKWSSVVDALKLRAAYGESGRQPSAFSALRTYSPVQGPGGVSAVTPSSFGNPDLKPERGKEIELGFESGLFNRLSLDFTYFSKKTVDEILRQQIAPSTGFPGDQFVNLGEVSNHGIEVRAGLQALTWRSLGWEIVGSFATNKDEIDDLGGLPTVITTTGQFNKVGYPIGGFFTKRIVSADRDATTGLATNVLCDGGPGAAPVACASAPFVFIGTPTPKTSGAVGNTVTVGRWLRLYALVDFKRGHKMLNANEQIRCLGLAGAPLCRANYYPQEFAPTYLAQTVLAAAASNTLDAYYQDASFTKLREVSATLTPPESWRWLRGPKVSLTLAARELHTWTSYRGPDPEVNVANVATSSTGQDQATIPPLSRLIATLNVRF
jgi:TonB-linked SusC/RagA family outer membrane protein